MPSSASPDDLAVRLALAVKRLRARMRETHPPRVRSLPIARLAILKRLRDDGPTTATALAGAEHVTQQAIAQHVAALRASRLVRTAPDPSDGRKLLLTITKRGLALFDAAASSRNAWLTRAIAAEFTPAERRALEQTIGLLERIAALDADVAP